MTQKSTMWRRWRDLMVAGAAVLILAGSPALADKRVALVIGNGHYRNANPLPNPTNDARAMAEVLRNTGFDVTEALDADKVTMSKDIDLFTEKAYGADLAVFYYAGHGMQVEGRNYLVPVDAELTSPAHLKTRAVSIDDVLTALPADPAVGVIILDACRDNPLARSLAARLPASRSVGVSSGLAPIQTSTSGAGTGGVLIAYATDPGAVALDGDGTANSPYTTALIRHLASPGVEIQTALTRVRGDVATATDGRQKPWHNASLGREVFVGPRGGAAAAAPATATAIPPAAGAAMTAGVEQRLWDEAAKRNTVEHYRAYLAAYPNGAFATMASINIRALEAAPAPSNGARAVVEIPDDVKTLPGTKSTEDGLALGQKTRVEIQDRLGLLGYDTGGRGGIFGEKSRRAIAGWQKSRGLPDTSYLTSGQLAVLRSETAADYQPSKVVTSSSEETRSAKRTTRRQSDQEHTGRTAKGKDDGFNEAAKFLGGAALAIGGGVLACKMAGGC
ncbi:caspase family protein [Pinisolibacter sp. B13]|uniref:caspase family protein n=1 Tax=Pinisolibacter aquiterrae TaxID=2815579 RepID=UPI001C3D1B02|nr:caspase family protein [Pinisolibacter aquiterrae]MBV5266612.1 caspase family protein [Pinisolibacter aquiterrae]